MKGYWIARYDVRDPEAYKAYVEAGKSAFVDYGAVFLARGGRCEGVEGTARMRNVIIEFPSFKDALDCWNSPVYQAARKLREPVSNGEIVLVEGLG